MNVSDTKRDPIRVAVVGMGYWGPNLVRVLNGLSGAEVACVSDKNSAAHARSRRIGNFQVSTMDEILADPTIDAVAIATPVSTHAQLATAALEAGKHVFVEKPLAANADDAVSVMELAALRGLVLMPGHTFLYSPPVNLARDLIHSGELGDVYFISMSRVNLGLHQPDVSVTWDLAPHDFSILCHWLAEVPVRVSAISRSCIFDGTPDVAFINLQYPSGTIVHVELSWLAPSKLRRTAVVGSRKMLVYDDTSAEPIRVFDSGADIRDPETFGEYRLSYRTGAIVSPPVESSEPLELELADFCRCVRTGDTPRSNVDLGLDVVRMVEAVDRSLEENGAPIELEELSRA